MLYGLVGAHRSGKTTLAKRIAEDLGIHLHLTSTTEVAQKYGFDPVAPMSLKDRIRMQLILLTEHCGQLDKLPRPLIVDRTPLDYMAYMLAEVGMVSHMTASPEILLLIDKFITACLNATRQHYDCLYYLDPLEEYVMEPGKPAENPAYQRHIALLIQGALYQLHGVVNHVIIRSTDPEFRSEFIHDNIVERLDEIGKMRASAPYH